MSGHTSIPHLALVDGSTTLMVHGRPFLMLAGEVHNSTSSSEAWMSRAWDKAGELGLNTLYVPVTWELVEPEEGVFDFTVVDALIDQARERGGHLVLLWFGAWKNGGWVTSPDIPAGGECFLTPVADYHVTVSAPENWQVIGTGDEEQVSSADGRTSFEVTAEKVRDCALVFSSGLSMAEEKTEGILVRAWYYEGREEDKEVLLTSAVRAVEAFTKEFGPYPYDSIDVAETGLFAGGMEYPQLVFISDDLWDYDWYAPRFLLNSTFGITTAHEVAHNWFYAAVGNDEYNDSWLDESFASYCEYVYRMYISDIGEGEPFTWVEAEIDAKNGFYARDRVHRGFRADPPALSFGK